MPYPSARSPLALSLRTDSDGLEFDFGLELYNDPSLKSCTAEAFPESPIDVSPELSPTQSLFIPAIPPVPSLPAPVPPSNRRLFPNATNSVVLGTSRVPSIRKAFTPGRPRAHTVAATVPRLKAVRHSIIESGQLNLDVRMVAPPDSWRKRLRSVTIPPALSNVAEADEETAYESPRPAPRPLPRIPSSVLAPSSAVEPRQQPRSPSDSWVDSKSPAMATGAEELDGLDDRVREALYVNASLRARGFAYEPASPSLANEPDSKPTSVRRAKTLPVGRSEHVLAMESALDTALRETTSEMVRKLKIAAKSEDLDEVHAEMPRSPNTPSPIASPTTPLVISKRRLRQAQSVPDLKTVHAGQRRHRKTTSKRSMDKDEVEKWVKSVELVED